MKGIKRISQKMVGRAVLWTSIAALVFVALARPNPGALQSGQNQTPSITALNVFKPDLADVQPANLIAAINQLKAQAKCRPPRITFKVVVAQDPRDKYFSNKLAEARKDAVEEWLRKGQSGLEPDQYKSNVTAEVIPNVPYPDAGQVQLNFEQFNDQDKDPPKLKDITWSPPDGSVVSAGQQIEVKLTASERYEDGHKSWPSGVKSITLVAIGEKVSEWPNPSPESPKPCDPVTWRGAYTVPKAPPSTITVCVIAEDYKAHRSNQCAKFNVNVMPANCKDKRRAEVNPAGVFADFAPGYDDPNSPNNGKIICRFEWSVCGVTHRSQSNMMPNAPSELGICDAFWESEKAKLPTTEFCCECYPGSPAFRPDCSETKPKPRR